MQMKMYVERWYKNGARTDKGMFHVECYQCINVCPFDMESGIGHDLVRWNIRKLPFMHKVLKWGDHVFYKPMFRTGRRNLNENAPACNNTGRSPSS